MSSSFYAFFNLLLIRILSFDIAIAVRTRVGGPSVFIPVIAGGHANVWFKDANTRQGYIKKRTGPVEAGFYQWISLSSGIVDRPRVGCTDSNDEEKTQQALNAFMKTLPPLILNKSIVNRLSSFIPNCESIDIPLAISEQSVKANHNFTIELEDLVNGFRHPCVMDLKLGRQLYGDGASDKRKEYLEAKSKNQTSFRYGVAVIGMKIWNANSQSSEEISKSERKQYKELKNVESAVDRFLNAAPVDSRKSIAQSFKSKIKEIYEWFNTQEVLQFYSSSLLLYYDNTESDIISTVGVKMIDFAHVSFNQGMPDKGYLLGLKTLLYLLDIYLSDST